MRQAASLACSGRRQLRGGVRGRSGWRARTARPLVGRGWGSLHRPAFHVTGGCIAACRPGLAAPGRRCRPCGHRRRWSLGRVTRVHGLEPRMAPAAPRAPVRLPQVTDLALPPVFGPARPARDAAAEVTDVDCSPQVPASINLARGTGQPLAACGGRRQWSRRRMWRWWRWRRRQRRVKPRPVCCGWR